jgi:hypothetical protein
MCRRTFIFLHISVLYLLTNLCRVLTALSLIQFRNPQRSMNFLSLRPDSDGMTSGLAPKTWKISNSKCDSMMWRKDSCAMGQHLIFILDIVCQQSSIEYKTIFLKTKARNGCQ